MVRSSETILALLELQSSSKGTVRFRGRDEWSCWQDHSSVSLDNVTEVYTSYLQSSCAGKELRANPRSCISYIKHRSIPWWWMLSRIASWIFRYWFLETVIRHVALILSKLLRCWTNKNFHGSIHDTLGVFLQSQTEVRVELLRKHFCIMSTYRV